MSQSTAHKEEREFAFSDRDFRFLSELVAKRTGIVLADHKRDMVYSRLARRLRALHLTTFSDYCALVESDEGESEMGNLVNAITTNLTSFFRESHHFDHLRDHVIRPLAASNPSPKRLRIWSSACSSGMEPYSIAMTVKYALPNLASWDARILATDIDTNMLENGKKGLYPGEQFENIPAGYHSSVERLKQEGRICMADDLKQLIAFKHLNLLEHWPMQGPFDAIFCRNVVIYFDKPTQQKLFARMADLIKPNGWLYIGHSENLFNVCDRFELTGRTIYRKIR
jgi:chemotaxis protein methyltransferase CheR